MKSDINLLSKRKTKQFSSKNFAIILIGVLFVAGALYAGIALPSQTLSAVKASVTNLDADIQTSSHVETDLMTKTAYNQTLKEQISSLEALTDTQTDIYVYLETIEESLPNAAHLTQMNFSDNEMYIIGIASGDPAIATLCLRLRESGMFESVYLTNSTAISDSETTFTVYGTLPFRLGSDELDYQMQEEAANAAEAGE